MRERPVRPKTIPGLFPDASFIPAGTSREDGQETGGRIAKPSLQLMTNITVRSVTNLSAIPKEEYLYKCTSACAGCSSSLCLRYVLKAAGPDSVLVIPACCTSVIQGIYPGTAMSVPVYNVAFAASAACASGMSEAFAAIDRKSTRLNSSH